jgi:hypothetical protein
MKLTVWVEVAISSRMQEAYKENARYLLAQANMHRQIQARRTNAWHNT